jgi:hypothetical protein
MPGDEGQVQSILESALIDGEPLFADDFSGFIASRAERLATAASRLID